MQTTESSYGLAAGDSAKQLLCAFERMLLLCAKLAESKATTKQIGAALKKIKAELDNVSGLCGGLDGLKHSMLKEQLENTEFTLRLIESRPKQRAQYYAQFQLPCFLKELREEIYFWGFVYPDEERMNAYYQKEFAQNHASGRARGQDGCEVSIFVPARDKLEYTKQCVQSILEHAQAQGVSFELILINHGSTDGTADYFESVPGAKILWFKRNVKMLMFSSAFRVCSGRYMAFVSNDTVVTKDWLKLLLGCLKDCPDAVSATPATPHVSNYQSEPQSYQGNEELAKFAEEFNRRNPLKWQRRTRVIPVIALYDAEKVEQIGFTDRYFTTMEFWDDDFSLRARRAGYSQYLCRDVFCHHYGSVTGGEAQVRENTLQYGRALFLKKHGVDAWGLGAFYDRVICGKVHEMPVDPSGRAAVLGIDCGFGDTPLQIANIFKERGLQTDIDIAVAESKYERDLRALGRGFLSAKNGAELVHMLQRAEADVYDFIYIGSPLERYEHWEELLSALAAALKPGGILAFNLSNALSAENLRWLMSLAFPPASKRLCYINPFYLQRHLTSLNLNVERQPVSGGMSAEALTQFASRLNFAGRLPEDSLRQTLGAAEFVYFAEKNKA